jgi:hypothetical protein
MAFAPLLPLIYAAFLIAGAQAARAGTNVWTSNGPYLESVTALAIDPHTPSTLYAGTGGAGVFRSTNSGSSWSAVNTGLTGPFGAAFPVTALAIDPHTPSTLYAGTEYEYGYGGVGVFQSTNSGASWSAVNSGLADPSGTAVSVTALAIDPHTPSTLYAGAINCPMAGCSGAGVFQSTNSGSSWSAVNTGLSGDALTVNALAIDPHTPSTLYASTDAGVFSIQQIAVCVGDCEGTHTVAVNDIITLVNIALGTAQPSVCANGGLPIGGDVTIAVLIQAVNHALSGCGGP